MKKLSQKGSSNLTILVMISSGIALTSMITLSLIENSKDTSVDLIKKKESLFAAEGGVRLLQKLSQKYLNETIDPTSEGLSAYVEEQTQDITIGNYNLDNIETTIEESSEAVIPSGPFEGMNAKVSKVDFKLRVANDSNTVSSLVSQKSIIGTIKLFQFFMFTDGYTEWTPGPPQDVQGRVHINDDICLGGSTGFLSISKITSAKGIYLISNNHCRAQIGNAKLKFYTGTNFAQMKTGADHNCSNCDNSGMSWKDYALNKWGGNVLDSAHDVPRLRLPGMGVSVTAQQGRNNMGAAISNNDSMRVIVDPVLPSDTHTMASSKFAYQADIRIINGVWYLKNPNNEAEWPGMPIWSDHPGEFQTTNEEGIEGVAQQVGQDSLRTSRNWTDTPKYYSYYEYDAANTKLFTNNLGVISYGNLYRDNSAGLKWIPGHWTNTNMSVFCPASQTCTNCTNSIMKYSTALSCTGGGPALDVSVGVLNATRGGFMNGHAQDAPGGSAGLARQYPMNFDVDHFQQALSNKGSGELGSYFGANTYMNRDFNGIIYISNTWQNSMRGTDGTNTPADWPIQGAQNDAAQPTAAIHAPARIQRALPYELCSTTRAGADFDGAGGGFVIPNCASYTYTAGGAAPAINARPNNIRIINGKDLRPDVLPVGLTIATNLPAYVLGEYNTSSDTSSQAATPWLPALIASDFISHLSNAWDDVNSRWNSAYIARTATSTTYNHSILAGYTQRAENGAGGASAAGLNTFTRYNEDWSNKDHVVNGSLVVGFTSVYFRFANVCCSINNYEAPDRDWRFDEHLNNYINQPPGAPSFYIYAVESWRSGK